VVDLFAKGNPVPRETSDAVLPTPKPVKVDPVLAEGAAPVEAAGTAKVLAVAEDAVVAPKAGTEDERVVLPVATVEAVVVVTVENSGAEDVVNEKEPVGFEADAPEAAEEEAVAEAALGNPKEG